VFETSEGYIAVMSLKLTEPLKEIPEKFVEDIKTVFIKSSSVASYRHAAIATYRALRAFKEGKNITRNLRSEIAVCLTGERQIHKALGFTNPIGTDNVVFIAISAKPLDWNKLAVRVCDALRAVQTNEFGSMKSLARKLGVENLSSCSRRLELIILEKAALVELER